MMMMMMIALLTFKSITVHVHRPTYPTYFNSERHHVVSAPATIVCFTMLGPGLFSAVGRSATPFPQFGTHYQLISLIIRTTCFYLQPQNVFLLTFIHDLVINCVRACDCEIAAVLRRSTVDCTTNTNCTGDTRFLCGCAHCMEQFAVQRLVVQLAVDFQTPSKNSLFYRRVCVT